MQYPAILARGSHSLAKYMHASPATVMLALDLVGDDDLDLLDLTDEQLFSIFEIKVARWKAVMNQLYDRFSTPNPRRSYYNLGSIQMIFKPTALIACRPRVSRPTAARGRV